MNYEVAIYDSQGHCLGSFFAVKLAQSNVPGSVGTLQISSGTYHKSGVIHSVKVYDNHVLYAQWEVTYPYTVAQGQSEKDTLVHVYAISLVGRPVAKVCTCGGWAVYGREADIHADDVANTCELRMK